MGILVLDNIVDRCSQVWYQLKLLVTNKNKMKAQQI